MKSLFEELSSDLVQKAQEALQQKLELQYYFELHCVAYLHNNSPESLVQEHKKMYLMSFIPIWVQTPWGEVSSN